MILATVWFGRFRKLRDLPGKANILVWPGRTMKLIGRKSHFLGLFHAKKIPRPLKAGALSVFFKKMV
jgi:hypothetical protein